MTKQEIFDKVVTHLGKQRAKSTGENSGGCLYRGPNGRMCAVGCLIEDEYIDVGFMRKYNSASVDDRNVRNALSNSGIEVDFGTLCFLRSLQDIHDFDGVHEWKLELEEFGKNSGLNISAVDKAFKGF